MKICPKCNSENPDKAKFCLACGFGLNDFEATQLEQTRDITSEELEKLLEEAEADDKTTDGLPHYEQETRVYTGRGNANLNPNPQRMSPEPKE